jgi:hypothetical protein
MNEQNNIVSTEDLGLEDLSTSEQEQIAGGYFSWSSSSFRAPRSPGRGQPVNTGNGGSRFRSSPSRSPWR